MDTSSPNGKMAQETGHVITPSAKKQKLGERKSDVAGGDDYLVPLRLTARSGYLAVEEVARLLLFTGKTFMGDIFGDLRSGCQERPSGRLARIGTANVPLVEDVGPFRYVHNIELTRNIETKTFGFTVSSFSGKSMDEVGCEFITADATMQSSETIERGDVIIRINERDVRRWRCSDAVKEMCSVRGNVLILSIRRFCPDTSMHLWKCICQHKWRDSRALSLLMQNVGRRSSNGEADGEGIFREFCSKKKNLGFRPAIAAFNYSFLVSVYDTCSAGVSLDSAPVACLVLDDRNAENLLVKGKTGWIKFDSPTKIGTFKSLEDVEEKIRKWCIGLNVLGRLNKMSRKVDIQSLDSGSLALLDDGDGGNDSAGDSGNSDNVADNGDETDGGNTVKSYYYTRKHAVQDLKGLIVGGDLSGLITDAHVGVDSCVDIELKRNLRCSVQVHKNGKHVCILDAISVEALIRVATMNETERVPFSEHQKIKSGVTLRHFLARLMWQIM